MVCSTRGTLSLREKRSGTKLVVEINFAYKLRTDVFQGPLCGTYHAPDPAKCIHPYSPLH